MNINNLNNYDLSKILQEFFNSNKGYNTSIVENTGIINKNNKEISFSNAINLGNGRVLFVPYNYDKIVLFNPTDGSIVERMLPNDISKMRFINAHLLNNSKVLLIPADSGTPVVIYDAALGTCETKSKCLINGDIVFKDIFVTSVKIDNRVFCVNKHTNKCFYYYIEEDKWEGINTNTINTPNEGSACLTLDNKVFLTNRQDVFTKECVFQVFDPSTNVFTNITSVFGEFVACLPGLDKSVWVFPFNSNKILNIKIQDSIEISEYVIDVIDNPSKVTLGACYLPNGNILISPYGIPNAIEFNPINKTTKTLRNTTLDMPSYTSGAIVMTNGLTLAIPGYRKTGIVFGTVPNITNKVLFVNNLLNTSH